MGGYDNCLIPRSVAASFPDQQQSHSQDFAVRRESVCLHRALVARRPPLSLIAPVCVGGGGGGGGLGHTLN